MRSQPVGLSFGVGRTFARGAFVVEAERPADTIHLIQHGQVRVYRLDEDGRETVTAILGPGHLVGIAPLLGYRQHTSFAQAVTLVETWALPTDQLLPRLTKDRLLLGLIAGGLAQRFALAAGLYRDVHLLPVLERLADVEARLAICLRGEPLALSQAALAQFLHARPETLARKRAHRPAVETSAPSLLEARWDVLQVFSAGALVLAGDLPPNTVGQLVSGQLELSLVTATGRSIEFDVLGPGDIIEVSGLVGMPSLGQHASALQDGALRVMDVGTFLHEIAERPEQLQQVSARLAARLVRLEDRLSRSAGRIDERLLDFLRSLPADGTADGAHKLPRKWSHAQIGVHFGAARETITRMLAQLEARGEIHRQGRQIVVHRPSAAASPTRTAPYR